MKALSRIVADQRGGVFLEFTVVAPLLIFLCFGIVQYGLMLFVYNNMFDAARQGARELAVSAVADEAAILAAEATVAGLLVEWPTGWFVDAKLDGDDVIVLVTVPAEEASIIKVVPMAETLAARVVMRKEP